MTIETPRGVIAASKIVDTYPNICIHVDGVLAVVVEYDPIKDCIRTHAYNTSEDSPVFSEDWKTEKE